jgi:type II secretory pathway pseudopilin PulG
MKTKTIFKNSKKGFGLLEVVISASILSIFIVSIVAVFQTMMTFSLSSVKETQASFLAEEGIEAVKSLRDRDWDSNIATLNSGTDYYISYVDGTGWVSTTVAGQVDEFTRNFTAMDVYRDGDGKIVDSGGTLDPNTKKIEVDVSWTFRGNLKSKNLITYITNLHG